MIGDMIQFEWTRNREGHRWEEMEAELPIHGRPREKEWRKADCLVRIKPKNFEQWDYQVDRFQPLREDTALFRQFAATSPTKAEILKFAGIYGMLGFPEKVSVRRPSTEPDSGRAESGVEPIDFWTEEILMMRSLVGLWRRAKGKEEEGELPYDQIAQLISRIVWNQDAPGDTRGFFNLFVGFNRENQMFHNRLSRVPGIEWPELPPIRAGNYAPIGKSSMHCIHFFVNDRLDKYSSQRLLFADAEERESRLFLVPNSLIGAIWLQFAKAVDGNRNYRACEQCGTWFEVSPQTARSHKKYCSSACRVKQFRNSAREDA